MKIFQISLVIFVLTGLLIAVIAPVFSLPKNETEFKKLCSAKSIAGNIPVAKYVSIRTGLTVVIANIEGPIVKGYLVFATETDSDDGLPHTLEHLAFLGSEDYPYKGVLDLLANRCLAEGTNAWTAVDHTAYTVGTAGKDGILNLLPIYLDNLLYPTLTDAAFTTEVYHITGDGQDAGVVYSEMQARENTGPELTYNKMLHVLYPEPSGYHYETGGMMANIRDSLTNEKIRTYHKAMYRPENLNVIIAGQVDSQEVFEAIKVIEDKIVSKGDRGPFNRPWTSPVPPFTESQDVEVVYSSDKEDTGIIRVGWRGPDIIKNLTEYQSMGVLMKYLAETSVSPLPKIFVEVENPLASSVSGYTVDNSVSFCSLGFSGVPKDKINDVKPLLFQSLYDMANDIIPFNMGMMQNTLNNLILRQASSLENSPHSTFSSFLIQDFLYGSSCDTMYKSMNKISWYKHLLSQPASYWTGLIDKYLVSTPSVVVRGIPSIAEGKRVQEAEKKRLEKRKEELGEAGLKQWEDKVAEAKRINDIPPPDSMLESVPVPSTQNIQFHPLKVYTNIENQNISKSDASLFDLDSVPVKMQLDDVKSNFVQIVAILNTKSLSPNDRLYIPLLMELLLESPIVKDGKTIPSEEVVRTLHADTLSAGTINGLSLGGKTFSFGSFFNNVGLNFKVELSKYEKGVQWIKNILFGVVWDAERVSVKATKLLNSVGDHKRNGRTVATLLFKNLVFRNDTNTNRVNPFIQEKFLKKVISTLGNDPDSIIMDLKNVYGNITQLNNITIHLAANLEKLASITNSTGPWLNFASDGSKSTDMALNPIPDWMQRNSFDNNQSTTAYVTGLGSVESGYILQTTPAITGYYDEDLPAFLTAISYLTQMEGPMWKQIRGRGLSYTYSISMSSSTGMLSLQLIKSAQPIRAYKEAIRIINSYLNGTEPWKQLLFESARSSLIYEVVNREVDISDVIQQSVYAYYRKVPHSFNKAFVNAINAVKLEDLNRVAQKYFRAMVDPEQSQTIVVIPTSKSDEIISELSKMGHVVEKIENFEESRFASL